MIRKSVSVLPGTMKVLDPDQGVVEAFVNTTGVIDFQKDIMECGCWTDVIKAADAGDVDRPATVWGHDWTETTGKVLTSQELPAGHPEIPEKLRQAHPDAGTIKITVAYNLDTQRGREAFSDVKFGAIKQWSVGFIPSEDGVRYDAKGIRHISKVAEWPEVSNVLVGASPGTFTAMVKTAASETPEERKERTTDRLARGKAILVEAKSQPQRQREGAKDGSEPHVEPDLGDGPQRARQFVRDLFANGPDPSSEEIEEAFRQNAKDQRLPTLQGDEAPHNEPLKTALASVERLISQEVAEDEPEFDCVIRLACIGQQLLDWAAGEALGDGSLADAPMAMPAYLAAGISALSKTNEEPVPLSLPDWFAASMHAAAEQALAAAREAQLTPIPPPHVPTASATADGLTNWARARARPRFGG